MPQENMNQEFRMKKADEIRNYLIEGINQNESISKKHKKVEFSIILNARVLQFLQLLDEFPFLILLL